jgi:CRP-like cAMP-binding protein
MFDPENYHLKSSSLTEALSPKEKAFVEEKMLRLEYKKRQVIFKEDTYSKGLYVVRKGKIKIYKSSPQGTQTIVYIYRKGDYFGYRPLLAEAPHPVTAVAMDNVVLSYIPREAFISLFNRSETFARHIALTLSSEFSVWINKMSVFSQYTVKERVALSLLILARIYQREGEKRVSISISRDDFASFVGTARESLVRNLRHFKDEKIISTQSSKIVLLKPDALHAYF